MKAQIYLWLVAILAVLAVWFFLSKRQVQMSYQINPTINTAGTVSNPAIRIFTSNAVVQQQAMTVVDTNDSNSAADTITRYRQGLINKGEAIQEVLMEENKKSLDIYGKVVDQYDMPVSGAKVEGSIGLNVSFVESGGEYKYTETDSQGLFNFLGIHGTGIGISPQKEGYFYNQRILPGRPTNYSPDPNNPLVFTMWKRRGAEPLIASSINAKISHDGSPITFETSTGKVSPDGDLRVTLSQFPLDVRTGRERFDWAVKVEIINGGMIEENDPYPYWVPTNGYQPLFEFNVSSNAIKWVPGLKKNFYIKTAQGQYGMMQFSVYPGRSPTGLDVDFTINPSGSQNLEPGFSK